jgi:hypothetical protein
MNDEVRLPGYGGAGVFIRRAVVRGALSSPGVDVWLVGPEFVEAVLGRATLPGFLADLARFLFAVAGAAVPEQDPHLFEDPVAGFTIEITGSDNARVELVTTVTSSSPSEPPGCLFEDVGADAHEYALGFETSRAALANTAQDIAELVGGMDLADFGRLS